MLTGAFIVAAGCFCLFWSLKFDRNNEALYVNGPDKFPFALGVVLLVGGLILMAVVPKEPSDYSKCMVLDGIWQDDKCYALGPEIILEGND